MWAINVGFFRDIHVALYDWKDVNFLMDRFIKYGQKQAVYIDQRFGPDTTFRRNMAMKERKTLMETKEYKSSHVKFPAILVTKSHEKGAKYKVHKNFSSIDVPDNVPDHESE